MNITSISHPATVCATSFWTTAGAAITIRRWRRPPDSICRLVKYGEGRGVGLILWLGYLPFAEQMEELCEHYSEMGIKGFKVDFMDRDDQQMVRFVYDAARTAARHKLLLDLHGIFKPAGIQRTYPNVINFEGVHGLEQVKWSPVEVDQVTYDVTVPFIRMMAGPMDYTQGAMRISGG